MSKATGEVDIFTQVRSTILPDNSRLSAQKINPIDWILNNILEHFFSDVRESYYHSIKESSLRHVRLEIKYAYRPNQEINTILLGDQIEMIASHLSNADLNFFSPKIAQEFISVDKNEKYVIRDGCAIMDLSISLCMIFSIDGRLSRQAQSDRNFSESNYLAQAEAKLRKAIFSEVARIQSTETISNNHIFMKPKEETSEGNNG